MTVSYSGKIKKVLEKKEISDFDEVTVKKQDVFYSGRLIPRPAIYAQDHLIVKLKNGYNVGVKFDDIREITKVGGAKMQKKDSGKKFSPQKHDPKKPTIAVLSTGGTIASRLDYATGGVISSFSAQDLVEAVPELDEIANINAEMVCSVWSQWMDQSHWQQIAKAVKKHIDLGVDGVVILHGTDTMGYSAAALSFMLQDLPVPVVLTGAQRSTDRASADSAMNLVCAVHTAVSDVAEVSVVMHGESSDSYCFVHPGTKVRKTHSSRRDAFQSINALPFARVWPEGKIEFVRTDFKKRDKKRKLSSGFGLEEKVALIKLYNGFPVEDFLYQIKKGTKGIVLEGTGLGHITSEGFFKAALAAKKAGVVVCMCTQTVWGRVRNDVYEDGRKIQDCGVVSLEDMLCETAFVKLKWALSNSRTADRARALMVENLAGEITERTDPRTFVCMPGLK
ncbi:MAG: Glu-tRNA(Gln) amidotransferase subunit GatD [Candidatus Diapherotrites archaeon]|nr:Glu-tRNA(Gln) amidotransferase subunit GatD [Candidatus Diapherotrites archaeon]